MTLDWSQLLFGNWRNWRLSGWFVGVWNRKSFANGRAIDVKVYRLCGSRVGVAAEGPFVTIMSNNPLMLNESIADLNLLRHQTREVSWIPNPLLA